MRSTLDKANKLFNTRLCVLSVNGGALQKNRVLLLLVVVLFGAIGCTIDKDPLHVHLEEMGYKLVLNREEGKPWEKGEVWRASEPPLEVYPDVILSGTGNGMQMNSLDFGIFKCQVIDTSFAPDEAVRRAKGIFNNVPIEELVYLPENPEIFQDGLKCFSSEYDG